MKNISEKILNLLLPIISVALIVGVWAIASRTISNEYILPSVKATAGSLIALFKSKLFYYSFFATFLRSIISFVISFTFAFVLALLCNKSEKVRQFVAPLISVVRALPTIAVVLLLLLWTNRKIAPVIVTLLVVMPTSYTQLMQAFGGMDKTVIEAGKVDGANTLQLIVGVEYPLIAPSFYSAIGSGVSLNFKLMVAAEVIAQTANSLGYLLNTSKVYFETAQMFALVVASVITGVIIESVFNLISRKVGSWR